MRVEKWLLTPSVLAVAFMVGCGEDKPTQDEDGSAYLLSQEPAGAAGVRTVRESAEDEDDVVVVGRIGGMVDPWVEGFAAFSIVDTEMKPCNELGDDACPKPWDYC